MSIISKPHGDFTNNVDVANATYVNDQMNTAYNAINGGLDYNNVPAVGNPSSLQTTAQDTLVNAVNEVNAKGTIDFMFRQALINGNFDVWQRGTSFNIGNLYSTDRWFTNITATSSSGTVSRQLFTLGQSTVPNNPKYFMRINPTTLTGCTYFVEEQRIEGVDKFAGQKVTISFWAKADTTQNIAVYLRQTFGTGGTPSSSVSLTGVNKTLTTSWQKYTATYNVPSIAGMTLGTNGDDYLAIVFGLPITGTYSIDIAQVQVSAGDQALPFQPRDIDDEQRKCLRYNKRIGNIGINSLAFGNGFCTSSTAVKIFIPLGVRMRTTPTLASGGNFGINISGAIVPVTSISLDSTESSADGVTLLVGVASGLTAGQGALLVANADSTAYLNFDAEII